MSVTLAQASTVVDVALKKAREANLAPLTIAVLDAGGHLVAFKREDKSGILRFDIATGKAWGARGENPAILHHAGGGKRRTHGDQSRRGIDP